MKAFESAAVTAFKNSKRAEYAKENEGARIEKEALSVKVRAWRNATSTNALVRDHVTAMVARVRSKEADLAYMKHSCRSYFEEYIIALEWLETPAGEGTPLLPPGTGAIIDYYHKIVRGYKKRVKQLRKSLTAKSEEVITLHRRLLQQQAEREAAYDADKSMDASLPCSPIPPQSGTVSRTSCPRRDTDEPEASMSVKRKALIITPEKARPEDSEEESEEEEIEEEVTVEKKGESDEEDVTKCDACIQTEPEKARPEDSEEESEEEEIEEEVTVEKKGESDEEDVTKCDACIQTEPEKARPVTCETGTEMNEGDDRTPTDDKDVQTEEREDCLDEFTRHLRSKFKPYNPQAMVTVLATASGMCLTSVTYRQQIGVSSFKLLQGLCRSATYFRQTISSFTAMPVQQARVARTTVFHTAGTPQFRSGHRFTTCPLHPSRTAQSSSSRVETRVTSP
ncbi:hypothetical protein J8273_4975 [Carpediemonas membranifera]|uniref:Uncharacterized protein n=1 Tax=Carpediemonas membranifera TaxID=201153 RepID=A0A8J6B5V8_9EUKA|nr:hypothetical protein J8273_4975 [Carpediemonas membranifera]|eukprot:KAG9393497.1 hypothetical protein J8273_4975 [Carpediemonas membranifera]